MGGATTVMKNPAGIGVISPCGTLRRFWAYEAAQNAQLKRQILSSFEIWWQNFSRIVS